MNYKPRFWTLLLALSLLAWAGCGAAPAGEEEHASDALPHLDAAALGGGRLRVVATTSIVADVVRQVGGDRIELVQLLPSGADPHAFEPAPRDVAAISDAHVIFTNGAGLETFMEDLIANAGRDVPVVPLSAGVDLLAFGEDEEHADEEHVDEEHAEEAHEHDADPHTWFDPQNVVVWTRNVESALVALDPANASLYADAAARYREELDALDAWIREQVSTLPEPRRRLVTDHASFTYFAHAYGFEQVGTIFPGYSTLSAPSAQELSALEDAIAAHGLPAVFVGHTVDPRLAEQVAADTGVQLVFLYTGSLSDAAGPAGSYLDFMRYNVDAIVAALGE